MDLDKYNQIQQYAKILTKWNKMSSDRTATQIMLSATGFTRAEVAAIRAALIEKATP